MRPFKLLFILTLIALLSSALLPIQAQGKGPNPVGLRPDAPEYAKHGPYWVGTHELTIKDSKRSLPVTIWYPSENAEGKKEANTYTSDYGLPEPAPFAGHAILDAVPDKKNGPYPLVVLSHGAGGWRLGQLDLTEHLASQGFVVLAPDHIGNTATDYATKSYPFDAHIYRPLDITRTIDFAQTLTAKGGMLEGLIDLNHIAVIGHSFGGWTALVSAGARMNITELKAWCAKNPTSNWLPLYDFCAITQHEKELADLAGLKTVPDGLWPPMSDPRVTAIIPIAPAWGPSFGTTGLKDVSVPMLTIVGSVDAVYTIMNAQHVYDDPISAQKIWVMLDNADHNVYLNNCSAVSWLAELGFFSACSDTVWDIARAHDLINHFTTAFLLDVIKGDKDAHKALLPDAVKFVGIQYKTTLK